MGICLSKSSTDYTASLDETDLDDHPDHHEHGSKGSQHSSMVGDAEQGTYHEMDTEDLVRSSSDGSVRIEAAPSTASATAVDAHDTASVGGASDIPADAPHTDTAQRIASTADPGDEEKTPRSGRTVDLGTGVCVGDPAREELADISVESLLVELQNYQQVVAEDEKQSKSPSSSPKASDAKTASAPAGDEEYEELKRQTSLQAATSSVAAGASSAAHATRSASVPQALDVNHTMVTRNALEAMKSGSTFLKFGRRGPPHFRHVQLVGSNDTIQWFSQKKKLSQCQIRIADVTDIQLGQKTKVFLRKPQPKLSSTSFSIVYADGKKSLDLVAKRVDEYRLWVKGLSTLLQWSQQGKALSDVDDIPVTVAWSAFNDTELTGRTARAASVPRGKLVPSQSSGYDTPPGQTGLPTAPSSSPSANDLAAAGGVKGVGSGTSIEEDLDTQTLVASKQQRKLRQQLVDLRKQVAAVDKKSAKVKRSFVHYSDIMSNRRRLQERLDSVEADLDAGHFVKAEHDLLNSVMAFEALSSMLGQALKS